MHRKTGERSHQDTRWPMWSNDQGQRQSQAAPSTWPSTILQWQPKNVLSLWRDGFVLGPAAPMCCIPYKPRGHPWHGDSLLSDLSPVEFQLSAFLRILWAKCFARRLFCSPKGFIGMPRPQAVLTLAQLSGRGGINSERRCRGIKAPGDF